jgi:hypothetical protein
MTTDFKPTAEQKRLGPVFARVQHATDWKAPIDSHCLVADQAVVREAIIFYTATEPTFTPVTPLVCKVTAAGYRAGPAGDH